MRSANQKKFEALDDIGFIGTSKTRSTKQIKKDAQVISAFIGNYHKVQKKVQ